LVAIMGPSGSGKSALLDILAMKSTSTYTGEVLVNGHPRDPVLFHRIATFVPQEDCLPAHWTVCEALTFNAVLKRRPGSTQASLKAAGGLVDNLLEAFDLAKISDSYVGDVAEVSGISAGDRRRLALARGVASQASLLFCNGVTSGLTAEESELCARALRVVAKRLNVLVVAVFHQPCREAQDLFDSLILLTPNPGRMAYFGPMAEACSYFEACGFSAPPGVNSADFFLEILTPKEDMDIAVDLVSAFQTHQKPKIDKAVSPDVLIKSQTLQEMLSPDPPPAFFIKPFALLWTLFSHSSVYAVPFHEQLMQLVRRKLRITLRNPAKLGTLLAIPAVVGLILGILFQG